MRNDRYRAVFFPYRGEWFAICIIPVFLRILYARGEHMKEEEKKPLSWEVKDPKPPIIQSGRMENRRQQDQS